jgi:hypothetical protein
MDFWNKLSCINIKRVGIASFAQERIFLDERIRFSNEIAIYNELTILRVVQGTLSIDRLQRAIQFVLGNHTILRTSLVFNNDDGILKQSITDKHKTFALAVDRTFKNEKELRAIIHQTSIDLNLFDLSIGRVFFCEILRQQNIPNENKDKKFITNSDVIIIAFHHAANDRTSRQIFYNDLCMAYNNDIRMPVDRETLQYIDYSIHERLIDMTLSRQFWKSELEGYNLELPLLLPVDRHRSSNDQRSGLASTAQISFDNDFTTTFLDYASSHQVTPFQLGLATFYAFLFKLTHGQNDLCAACLNANRYRTELQNMIGMFVTTLPYRVRFDPQWSFDQLVRHVREKSLAILEHSYYPLQHIEVDSLPNQSHVLFLNTVFDFITLSANINQLLFNEENLEEMSLQESSEVAKFDVMLTFVYDSARNNDKLTCHLICSHDLFDEVTVVTMLQRFQYFFSQLFCLRSTVGYIDRWVAPVSKLSVILLDEIKELERSIFCQQSHVVNEGMFIIYLFMFMCFLTYDIHIRIGYRLQKHR